MDTKVQQQLLDRSSDFIDKAASTLGQTATHVYGVLVRQQFVEGVSTLIIVVIGFILLGLSIKFMAVPLFKAWNDADEYDAAKIIIPFGIFIGIMLLALVLIPLLHEVGVAIQKLINPEYFAIKFIFESVAGK